MDIEGAGGLDALISAVEATEDIPDEPMRRRVPRRNTRIASYLITINPNISADAPNAHDIWRNLIRANRQLVYDIRRNSTPYIHYRAAGDVNGVGGYTHANFIGMQVVGRNEIGGRYHRIHSHLSLQITHTSNIELNIPALRTFYTTYLGLPSVYINVRAYRHIERFVEEYIKKTDDDDSS